MARVAFVADVHVANHRRHGGPIEAGINRRCRMILDVLERACRRAGELGCDALVVLGDLFDTVRPEPQVIAATQRALTLFPRQVYLLVGNHDQVSDAPGDHALGPLVRPGVEVIERPSRRAVGDVELVLLPFLRHPSDAVPRALKDLGLGLVPPVQWGPAAVLCLHAGIVTARTPGFLRGASDAIGVSSLVNLCEEYRLAAAVAGNWHQRENVTRGYGPEVLQVGALVPTGWDNPGLVGYGTLAVFDRHARPLTYEEIPGPRFVTSAADSEVAGQAGCVPFVRITTRGHEEAACAAAWLQEARDAGKIAGGEAVPEASASAVAPAPCVVRDWPGALGAYVGSMPVSDDEVAAWPGTRSALTSSVLDRVRGYLKEAGA